MRNVSFISALFLLFVFTACENDLKDVEKISSNKVSTPVDKSTGVTIIYSDSAVVKGKLLTPLLNNYTEQKRFEMPKGLTIIFFDGNQKETSRVVADYGIRYETEKRVELRKNVVVTNVKGDVFKSEELIWDESKKMFYSNQLVHIIKQDGTDIYGSGFRSDENFNNPIIDKAYGNLMTGDRLNY